MVASFVGLPVTDEVMTATIDRLTTLDGRAVHVAPIGRPPLVLTGDLDDWPDGARRAALGSGATLRTWGRGLAICLVALRPRRRLRRLRPRPVGHRPGGTARPAGRWNGSGPSMGRAASTRRACWRARPAVELVRSWFGRDDTRRIDTEGSAP